MLIRVMYPNGKFDMVKPQILNNLLENQKVSGFFRSGGWTNAREDPLRESDQMSIYNGPERRNSPNA